MEFLVVLGGIGLVVFILPIVSLIKFSNLRSEFKKLKTDLDEQISELQRVVSKLEKAKEQSDVSQVSVAAKESDDRVSQAMAQVHTVHSEANKEAAIPIQTVDATAHEAPVSVDLTADSSSQDASGFANVVNDPWSSNGQGAKSKADADITAIEPKIKRESKIKKYLAQTVQCWYSLSVCRF